MAISPGGQQDAYDVDPRRAQRGEVPVDEPDVTMLADQHDVVSQVEVHQAVAGAQGLRLGAESFDGVEPLARPGQHPDPAHARGEPGHHVLTDRGQLQLGRWIGERRRYLRQLVEDEAELRRPPRSTRRSPIDVLQAKHDPAIPGELEVMAPEQCRSEARTQRPELACLLPVRIAQWPAMELVVGAGRRLDEDLPTVGQVQPRREARREAGSSRPGRHDGRAGGGFDVLAYGDRQVVPSRAASRGPHRDRDPAAGHDRILRPVRRRQGRGALYSGGRHTAESSGIGVVVASGFRLERDRAPHRIGSLGGPAGWDRRPRLPNRHALSNRWLAGSRVTVVLVSGRRRYGQPGPGAPRETIATRSADRVGPETAGPSGQTPAGGRVSRGVGEWDGGAGTTYRRSPDIPPPARERSVPTNPVRRRNPAPPTRRSSATSRSSPTSTTASPRLPTGCSS